MLINLREAFARNKKTFAILGAVAVAGLAFIARNRAKTGTTASTSTAPATTYTVGAGTSSSTPYSTTSTYDSTASDVYNSLQPQIEALQQTLSTTPVPAVAPTSQGFYQRAGTPAIYQAMSDGTLQWVDLPSWIAAGKPAATPTSASDPMWSRPVVGTDAPANLRTPA